MRVFLTGATGSIGSGILDNLLAHGHEVTSAVRSEQKGQEIAAKSPTHSHYIIFDLTPETASQLSELAVGYDAIIHTALTMTEDGIRAEHIATDAFIEAARKTAETKPVTLLTTSGCLVNGNTNGIVTEENDDTSNPFQMVAWRVAVEKKVTDATSGNLHGAVIRPVWVYGNSLVDHWLKASKTHNKIVHLNGNPHISFIHYTDLADQYRLIIENHGSGMFFGSEPESVTLHELVEKFSQISGVQEKEVIENPWGQVQNYGFFLVGQTLDQQIVSKKHKDHYGFNPAHKFLDWLATQQF